MEYKALEALSKVPEAMKETMAFDLAQELGMALVEGNREDVNQIWNRIVALREVAAEVIDIYTRVHDILGSPTAMDPQLSNMRTIMASWTVPNFTSFEQSLIASAASITEEPKPAEEPKEIQPQPIAAEATETAVEKAPKTRQSRTKNIQPDAAPSVISAPISTPKHIRQGRKVGKHTHKSDAKTTLAAGTYLETMEYYNPMLRAMLYLGPNMTYSDYQRECFRILEKEGRIQENDRANLGNSDMPRWKSQSGTVKQNLMRNNLIRQDEATRKYLLTPEGVEAAKIADAQSKSPKGEHSPQEHEETVREPAALLHA